MAESKDRSITLSDYRAAAFRSGYTPSHDRGGRFNLSSEVCHGGDAPTGVWVADHEGRVGAHCHRCPWPESDRNVRAALGLPEWRPPRASSDADRQPHSTERWEYCSADGSQSAVQHIQRHRFDCYRDDCSTIGAHKHSWIERPEGQKGHPLPHGLQVMLHEPPGQSRGLVVCEGQKTALAAVEAGWTGVSYIQGASYAGKADYTPLSGADEILVSPDNDAAGRQAAAESALRLLEQGVSSVSILDPDHFPTESGDLADLTVQKRVDLLAAAMQGIGATTYSRTSAVRVLLAQLDFNRRCAALPKSRLLLMKSSRDFVLDQQVADVWGAIHHHMVEVPTSKGHDPRTYLHAGALAVIIKYDETPAVISTLHNAGGFAKSLSSEAVYWYSKWKTETLYVAGEQELTPVPQQLGKDPADAVQPTDHALSAAVAAYAAADPQPFAYALEHRVGGKRGGGKTTGYAFSRCYPVPDYPNTTIIENWVSQPDNRLPPLDGILNRPMLDSKANRILYQPGYYRPERIFLDWQDTPVPLLPVADAIDLLDEYFGEFPYDSEGSRANFFAMALAGVTGLSITGPKPLFVINKATPRTGASLLAVCLSLALSGSLPKSTGGVKQRDEDMSKALLAAGTSANAVVLFDNVDGQVTSNPLNEYITTPVYSGRRLGFSDQIVIVDRRPIVDIMTGNNPNFGHAEAHRIVPIRLDAAMPEPGTRTGFRYPRLLTAVKAARYRLLGAILSLVQHWLDSGRPPSPPAPVTLGGFEDWQDLTGSILHAAGIAGFLSNVEEARAKFTNNADSEEAQAFIEYWWSTHGESAVGSGEFLVPAVTGNESTAGLLDLEGERKRTPKGIQTRMGTYLQKLVGKVFDLSDGNRCQVYVGNGPHRSKLYRLSVIAETGPSGENGLG